MGRTSRTRVKGVRKSEDVEMISLILWLQAKRVLAEKREREKAEREKRKLREQRS